MVDEALAIFGLAAVRPRDDIEVLYLWPENVESWNFFQSVSTQWNVGTGGAIGLNYPSVKLVMEMQGIRRSLRPALFAEVQAMERATLIAWAEKNKHE